MAADLVHPLVGMKYYHILEVMDTNLIESDKNLF
jgi:hypothetical protein